MLDVPPTASTGLVELDAALGGLYWGDNVVWEIEEGASLDPFVAAVAASRSVYDFAAFVSFAEEPREVAERLDHDIEVLDARLGAPLAQPGPLLNAVRQGCLRSQRPALLVFDSLDRASVSWGTSTTQRFFTRGCPLLLELGAIAYWSFTPREHPHAFRREIENVTQCVLEIGADRLRIVKAEGRPPGIPGSVFRYRVEDGRPELAEAPAAARLSSALRALRLQRRLNQSELARIAGVSPSAISQAERGQRGLSLETLLALAGRLGITLDQLLTGEVAPGYRLARRAHYPRRRPEAPLPLLDDPSAGLRAYLIRLPPGASSSPTLAHKGAELVAVASGLVQVVMPAGSPVLRQGETLLAGESGITAWKNLGDGEALVFWILRDA